MNRPIKFRGKSINPNVKYSEWFYGSVLTNKLGTYIITEENPHECTQYGYLEISEYVRVDPETVGQSTGLEDKNGVEIYEGDIVKITVNDRLDWNEVIGKVRFMEGAWWVEDVGNFAISLWSEMNESEVVGNIYENPELLEGADE